MKRLLLVSLCFLSSSLPALYAEDTGSSSPAAESPGTLAIMDVTVQKEIPQSLADLVTSFIYDAVYHAAKKNYKVIARNLRDELLREIEFSQSELSDNTASLLEAGKYLCVQFLLTGSISRWQEKTYLTLQLVDVATSEVIGSTVRPLSPGSSGQPEVYLAVQELLAISGESYRPQSAFVVKTATDAGVTDTPREVSVGEKEAVLLRRQELQEHQDKLVEMVPVKGGVFLMGSERGKTNEKPVHEVRLSGFLMSRYEITHGLYLLFCRSTNRNYYSPAKESRENLPARYVSWYDACAFCNWLSRYEGLAHCYTITDKNVSCDFNATGYRLPTEAEWEFAATGGLQTRTLQAADPFAASAQANPTSFAGGEEADEVAWYKANAKNSAQPVGGKKPNALGLYDLSGNVWEWCWDWYAADYYTQLARISPVGPGSGHYRSLRGGGWNSSPAFLRTTARGFSSPADRFLYTGFRIVRRVEE